MGRRRPVKQEPSGYAKAKRPLVELYRKRLEQGEALFPGDPPPTRESLYPPGSDERRNRRDANA